MVYVDLVRSKRFESLVATHHRSVRTYAHSLASTPTIAEHAIQETFLRAWKYLDSFGRNGSFEGWLLRITRNCVYDLEAIERKQVVVELNQRTVSQSPDHQHEVIDAVARLPVLQREVITLCGLLGYDYETAARILDVPVGTVRSRLNRARSALAIELKVA